MTDRITNRPSFFFIISIVGVLAVLIGFAKTFIVPTVDGTFKAPISIHIHGAFAFAWILLFLTQASLIYFRKYHIHRFLGITGIVVAAGVTITIVPIGLYVVRRDLTQGLGDASYLGMLGIITGIIFFSLVLAGIATRNRPEYHKRFMLLATIVVLWPAWFRFRHYFPSVPRPDIWFGLVLADSLIVISWIWDKLKNGRIHPVLKYFGLFIILEGTFEVIMFDNPTWRVVAKWTYNLFSHTTY